MSKRADSAKLRVVAGFGGTVQEIEVQPGQRVVQGSPIAKIADERKLQAVLAVPETMAREVIVGQPATIDTHAGIVTGSVTRIDPASQNGAVDVVVSFSGHRLPSAARPELTVDGSILVSRVPRSLSIPRPAGSQDDSSVDVFRLDGTGMIRKVRVRLGAGSLAGSPSCPACQPATEWSFLNCRTTRRPTRTGSDDRRRPRHRRRRRSVLITLGIAKTSHFGLKSWKYLIFPSSQQCFEFPKLDQRLRRAYPDRFGQGMGTE